MYRGLVAVWILFCRVEAFVVGWSTPAMVFPSYQRKGSFRSKSMINNSLLQQQKTHLFAANESPKEAEDSYIKTVLFIECGFGNDSHGQNATKAAVRACRNAIEFNSIPSVRMLVPGGYDGLKLKVHLAVPAKYQDGLDLDACAAVFPYGNVEFAVQDGGMVAPSGRAIESLGDRNDDMIVVCCSVMVGY